MDKLIDKVGDLLAERGDVGLTLLIAGLIGWFLVSTILRLIAEGKESDAAHAKELRELAEKTATGLAESRSASVLVGTQLAAIGTQFDKANTVLAILPHAVESLDDKLTENGQKMESTKASLNDLSLKLAEALGKIRA